jgi:multidrug efflux pump subunit AcrA (membrane-fusion protein)
MKEPRNFLLEGLRLGMPIVIVAGAVLAFVALGGPQQAAVRTDPGPATPLVQTVQIEAHTGNVVLDIDGVVVPYRTINVAAEVAGRVVRKAPECEAGEYVARGTVLMEIDPRDYQLDVKRLDAELERAVVALQENDVELTNTGELISLAKEDLQLEQNELQRLRQLPPKFSSDTELDKARMAVVSRKNALQVLENQTRLISAKKPRLERDRDHAQALLDQARLDLERTKIVAPADGVIYAESVEEGGFAQPGTTLFTFEDTSQAEVACQLKPEEIHWLWKLSRSQTSDLENALEYSIPRTPVTVTYEVANQEFGWKGELVRYDGLGMDEKTRTVRCRVVVPRPTDSFAVAGNGRSANGDEPDSAGQFALASLDEAPQRGTEGPPALMRGMYVRVHIHLKTDDELLRISERAIQPGGFVWLFDHDRLRVRPIDVARASRGEFLVRRVAGQLDAGDKLIVSPLAGVEDGMAVREAPPR